MCQLRSVVRILSAVIYCPATWYDVRFISVITLTVHQIVHGRRIIVVPQAFGGGDVEALPAIMQRAVLFSLLHCVPITALLFAGPSIMKW